MKKYIHKINEELSLQNKIKDSLEQEAKFLDISQFMNSLNLPSSVFSGKFYLRIIPSPNSIFVYLIELYDHTFLKLQYWSKSANNPWEYSHIKKDKRMLTPPTHSRDKIWSELKWRYVYNYQEFEELLKSNEWNETKINHYMKDVLIDPNITKYLYNKYAPDERKIK